MNEATKNVVFGLAQKKIGGEKGETMCKMLGVHIGPRCP